MGTITVLPGQNRPLPPTEGDATRTLTHVSGAAVFVGELGAGEAVLTAGGELTNLTGAMSVRNDQLVAATVAYVDNLRLPGVVVLSTASSDAGKGIDAFTGLPLSAGGGAGGALTPTAVKTGAYVALAGELVLCDTTTGSLTVTAPAAIAAGLPWGVKHIIQGGTNLVTIVRAGADTFDAGVTSLALTRVSESRRFSQKLGVHVQDGGFAALPTPGLVVGRPGAWDPTRSIYNATAATLRRWRAARNRAAAATDTGASPARLNVYGDSISNGVNSGITGTTQYGSGYVSRLRALLATLYGTAGSGIVATRFPAITGDGVTYGGTWVAASFGVTGQCALTSTAGSTLTFTATCDSFNLWFVKFSGGGSFTYSIDGAAAVTVSAVNAAFIYSTLNVAAGALGSHTIVITNVSGSTYMCAIEGAAGSAAGIRVSTLSQSGATSNAVGGALGTAAASGANAIAMDLMVPDLAVIAYGVNDYGANTGGNINTPAVFKTQMQTAITKLVGLNSDVLLLVEAQPNFSGAGYTSPYSAYVSALYDLADTNGLALVDITDRWGPHAIHSLPPLVLQIDGLHPTDRGHRNMADAVYAAVTL